MFIEHTIVEMGVILPSPSEKVILGHDPARPIAAEGDEVIRRPGLARRMGGTGGGGFPAVHGLPGRLSQWDSRTQPLVLADARR
jgi:hypothetical protein